MSTAMDFEFSARYLFGDEIDFYHDFHGECEDCGRVVAEWSLLQCQYGFCGKFVCENCGFRCKKCGDEPRTVCLCYSHARIVYPPCDNCKRQFCDICSTITVTECKSCLKHFCARCQNQENKIIRRSGTCDNCGTKGLRSLREICRCTVRAAISTAVQSHPSEVDQNVQHLPLPGPMKNYICYQ